VWELGIGNWVLGIGPNPQSPIPNPQSPIPNPHFETIYSQKNIIKKGLRHINVLLIIDLFIF